MTASTATSHRNSIRNPLDEALVTRLLKRVTVADQSDTKTISTPFTGEELAQIPVGTQSDVDEAFKRARAAQKVWARVSMAQRRDVLHHFHDLLFTHSDKILDVLQAETGKNRASAHEELIHTAITARYYGNQAEKMLAPKKAHGAIPVLSQTTVYHHPKGVVGVISPWNYPLTLAISDALAALMAGNAIVLKPDSTTPFTALLAVDLLYRAGLPDDVFQVVPGPGRVVGQSIVSQCDYLMFTGSSETGRGLAQQAGERLIGFSAELGGKNPLIVAEDANVDRAVEGARIGAFTNSGHLCVSIERIYVADAVWDEFVPAFTDRVKAMSLGIGYDWEIEMGCLQSQSQFDTVKTMVDEAIEAGATVLAGGRPRPDLGPLFYEPTVLTDVPEDVALLTEEVFGPVVVLHRVADVHEGIAKANDSRYGLNASLWTSPKRAKELAPQIEAGSVNVNDGFAASFASVDAPMGGFKESGVGRRQAEDGLLKYTDAQTVTVQRITPVSMPALPRETYAKVFNGVLQLGKKLRILP
ncbi:MAG: succinic semialdehyde dehydrogenase [Corynebacterium sp.]|uniref:succinic semialdehyde dehydrogenase n=1 Tax=Corynebacterium sp. TaxID=1720 RepID=UPI0026DC528F|nr:succinic semialdehyde dehydrogenase [Corynebacterium sp.]MDO5030413.1 succinic semialdehyde dehydrogenase [Corynebacterium sp.]